MSKMLLKPDLGNHLPDALQMSDLEDCPTPVARYLQKVGIVGQQRIASAHIVHDGEFRLKPEQKWFPIRGDYRFSASNPSFIWKASIRIFPLIFISVVDEYKNGIGRNHVKLESIFNIADKTGPEISESSLGRLLTEFMLIPTALLPSDQLRWEAIDLNCSRAILTSYKMEAIATFNFGDDGLPSKVSIERFGTFDGKIEKRPFIVRPSRFKTFAGLLLPTEITGSWLMDSGEFSWLYFKINSATFQSKEK